MQWAAVNTYWSLISVPAIAIVTLWFLRNPSLHLMSSSPPLPLTTTTPRNSAHIIAQSDLQGKNDFFHCKKVVIDEQNNHNNYYWSRHFNSWITYNMWKFPDLSWSSSRNERIEAERTSNVLFLRFVFKHSRREERNWTFSSPLLELGHVFQACWLEFGMKEAMSHNNSVIAICIAVT